jgi:hypothetical protein
MALQGAITLEVRNRHHGFESIEFIVDSGANITTIPISSARDRNLALPKRVFTLGVNTAAGPATQEVRAGRITVRVPGFSGRDFSWPCHFVADKDRELKALLALTEVIEDLRIDFDPTYALEAPHGWVVLEERAARPSH